jgi:Domain of unknown function (DUF4390)
MDFFTHCCKRLLESASSRLRLLGLAWALLLPALTMADGVRIDSLKLERLDASVQLSAQMSFELPPLVDDALHRGVPLLFSAEVTLSQDRWYWWDKVVVRSMRYWRLSYQPLTRRYRVQVSNQPIENAGLGVGQHYEELSEALSSFQRISAWNLGVDVPDTDAKYRLDYRFKLEANPLLRPWLSGASDGEWGLSVQRTVLFKPGAPP